MERKDLQSDNEAVIDGLNSIGKQLLKMMDVAGNNTLAGTVVRIMFYNVELYIRLIGTEKE